MEWREAISPDGSERRVRVELIRDYLTLEKQALNEALLAAFRQRCKREAHFKIPLQPSLRKFLSESLTTPHLNSLTLSIREKELFSPFPLSPLRIGLFAPRNDRFAPLNDRFDRLNDRFGPLNDRFGPLNDRFGSLNVHLSPLNDQFAHLTRSFAPLL